MFKKLSNKVKPYLATNAVNPNLPSILKRQLETLCHSNVHLLSGLMSNLIKSRLKMKNGSYE